MELERAEDGKIIVRPVLGWTTMPAMGTLVLLHLRYAETEEELQTEGLALQVILTPQQAERLADSLTRQAARVAGGVHPSERPN